MLKIEINEGDTSLKVAGKGQDILCEALMLVYVMARHFEEHSHDIAKVYRNLLIKNLTADDFWEMVASGVADDDGVQDDIHVQ